LLCTLILAVVLYGFVTWQYATLPPLYLLLGCAGWLYHEVLLHHLPSPCYFVGSLPAWGGRWVASRWAWRQRRTGFALAGYRASGALRGRSPESVAVPGDGRWPCRRSVCTACARVGLGGAVCLGAAAARCDLDRSGPAAEWTRQGRGHVKLCPLRRRRRGERGH